jgi:hypothetical protein
MKKMRWESHMEKELASKVERGPLRLIYTKTFFKGLPWMGGKPRIFKLFLSIFSHFTAKLEHLPVTLKH